MYARSRRLAATGLVVLLLCGLCQAQFDPCGVDVYKPGVPDVDKPVPGDNSCWLAAAADVLGAAGWKDAGLIYTDLTTHFGTANGGWSSVAINWWLLNHGLNPDSADFNTTAVYNDVTLMMKRLNDIDYDYLLDELARCQYVNVSFEIPGAELGHEMTLVGGNYSPAHLPPGMPQQSVWHDNQGDVVIGVDDDVHDNTWGGASPGAWWNLDYWDDHIPNDPNDWEADGATILCPSLQKPVEAMQNFDVAYYKDMDAAGNLFNAFRHAGEKYGQDLGDYTGPGGEIEAYWDPNPLDPQKPELVLPNESVENQWKEVWLLVDFVDRGEADPNVVLIDDTGLEYLPNEIEWNADLGQVRLHWILENQPAWEKIVFPSLSYEDLYDISTGQGGPVKDWDIATICIPEPATLGLLLVGAAILLTRRRRT